MHKLLGGLQNFTENKMSPVEPRTTLLCSQRTPDKSLLLPNSARAESYRRGNDGGKANCTASKCNSWHTLSASDQSRGSHTLLSLAIF